jgi:hypothetical protein
MPDAGSHQGHTQERRIARNAVLRASGEVVGKLASMAFFIAIARELGEGGFGDFVFALSLTTVLVLVCGLGTEDLVAREVSRDHDRVHSYLANAATVKALLSILPLLAAFGVHGLRATRDDLDLAGRAACPHRRRRHRPAPERRRADRGLDRVHGGILRRVRHGHAGAPALRGDAPLGHRPPRAGCRC